MGRLAQHRDYNHAIAILLSPIQILKSNLTLQQNSRAPFVTHCESAMNMTVHTGNLTKMAVE